MIENKGQSERKKMEDRNLLQNIPKPPKPSTPVLIISKLFVVVLPIAQVSIGGIHLNDCPKQPYIPIYLVVSGVFALVLGLLSCLPCTQEPEDGTQTPLSGLCTAWNSLVSLFLFCWFIAGNVWIYSIYQPSYTPDTDQYCNKTLYLFAFWTTTLVYIFLGMVFVGGCCMLFCMCLCGRGSGNADNDV
ncbi:transmembrane protein 272-like isoform X1 [Triplophysa dalaica]|uniref:transmembrane protein 272-like isoform X1 n=2 Tax=Triplophysa dalaica TaxID=1582913 RepID=UPI0024E026D6|nr:transmembrane protein 272-like isoform X1 [Triplophysa dalaica]